MYVIQTNIKKMKKLKKLLKERNIDFRETKFDDYIILFNLPEELPMKGLWIKEIPFKECMTMLKEYNQLQELKKMLEKPRPEAGDMVQITGGEYGNLNLKGMVKSVGKRMCEIETTVFGNIVRLTVPIEHVEVIKDEE